MYDFVDEGIRPVVDESRCIGCRECMTVCSGLHLEHDRRAWPANALAELAESWGPVLELWEGYAADEEIRFKGSSGGVATALGAYCLERKGMYGVLHAAMDTKQPHLSQAVLSRTRAELTERAGSRYAPVSVCAELGLVKQSPSPVVLLAKPCEIAAARKASATRADLAGNLGLAVGIFCGGTPSTRGTLEVLRRLGTAPDQIASLRYRGCGWPGNMLVNLRTGGTGPLELTYRETWDTVLTRHRPLRCLICPDGTGEFADIACGDPWYRPIQDGENGTTLIVVRTQAGRELLHEAVREGYIVAERRSADVLVRSQQGLLNRRRHVWPKLAALRLIGLPSPRLCGFSLWRGWLRLPTRRKFASLYRALRKAIGLRRRGPVRCGADRVQAASPIPRTEPSAEPSPPLAAMKQFAPD